MDDSMRDALISGMRSSLIRQKVLESNKTELRDIIEICTLLESAQRNAESYQTAGSVQDSVSSTVHYRSSRLLA